MKEPGHNETEFTALAAIADRTQKENDMAAWLPALKVALPYLTRIVADAIPAFTARNERARNEEVLPQQIAELQTAVTHNAESVKLVAKQLQQTIEGIDAGAGNLQQELIRTRRLCWAAIIVSVLAAGLSAWALVRG